MNPEMSPSTSSTAVAPSSIYGGVKNGFTSTVIIGFPVSDITGGVVSGTAVGTGVAVGGTGVGAGFTFTILVTDIALGYVYVTV